MSLRDCESERSENGGTNVCEYLTQNRKDKTPKGRAGLRGRMERLWESTEKREILAMISKYDYLGQVVENEPDQSCVYFNTKPEDSTEKRAEHGGRKER